MDFIDFNKFEGLFMFWFGLFECLFIVIFEVVYIIIGISIWIKILCFVFFII